MTWIESFGMLLGRLLMASYFLISSITKVSNFESTLAVYQQLDVPYPSLFLYFSTLLLIIGAIFIAFGYRTRLGAFILILALMPATYMFHHFWTQEGDALLQSFDIFFKDVAIVGGLLYIISRGPGLCSVDALRKRKKIKQEETPPVQG